MCRLLVTWLALCGLLFAVHSFADDGMMLLGVGNQKIVMAAGGTTFDPGNLGTGNVLSGGNLTVTGSSGESGAYIAAQSVASHSTGKFYNEYLLVADGGNSFAANLGITQASGVNLSNTGGIGFFTYGIGIYEGDSNIYLGGSAIGTHNSFVVGDTIGIAVDLGGALVWFRGIHSGTPTNWNNSGTANPALGIGGAAFSGFGPPPFVSAVNTFGSIGVQYTANFGGASYAASAPVGFGNW